MPDGHDPPFVGRAAELSTLAELLRSAAAGRGSVALVSGEPGIGKTRLADELTGLARSSQVRTVRGRCWEGGGAPSLYPFVQLLRGLRGTASDELLAAMRPGADRGAVGFELLDAIVSRLVDAAGEEPLLVVVDDLHAGDTATLAALLLLADVVGDVPLMVLGTYRDQESRREPEMARLLAELRRRGTSVALAGLGPAAVAELVTARTELEPAHDLVRWLVAATGGNPFFLEQMLPVLAERVRAPGRHVPVPQEVRDAIRWRLEPLDASTRALLGTAAVLGRTFDSPTLAATVGERTEAVTDQLGVALQAGLVRAIPLRNGRYEFVHSLVRETLYDDLPPDRRRELHRSVAELLDSLTAGDRAAEIAHHRLAALPLGDAATAIEAAQRAARRAGELSAYGDAAALHARISELLETSEAPPAERCDALLDLGESQRLAGDTATSRTTFLAALDLATQPHQVALGALGYAAGLGGHGFVDRGDDRVIVLLEQAVAAIGTGDSPLRARLLARLAVELYYTAAVGRRESLSQEAVEIAERVGDARALAYARYSRVWCRLGPEDAEERRETAEQLTQTALATGDGEMLLRGEHLRICTALELGDIVEVDRGLDRYARYAERFRQPLYRWHLETLRAMRAFIAGDLEESERRLSAALDLGLPVQGDTAALLFGVQLCTVRWAQGRLGEVEPALRVFVEHYPTSAWRPALVVAAVESGNLEEARALFEQLAADDFAGLPRDGNWLTICCYLAIPCAALEDRERAAILYELLAPYAARTAVANAGAVCYGSVSSFLGLLAATAGRPHDAVRHLRQGLLQNLAMGHLVMAAWTAARQAEVLEQTGDRAGASRAAADAARRSADLGIPVRPLLPDPVPTPTAGSVFRREGDVWTVVYDGRTSRLRDGKGPRYLAQLLANPGQRIAAIDLIGVDGTWVDGGAGPALDGKAKAAYRERLRQLGEEREEAERFNDIERVAVIDAEVEAIATEFRRAVGLGGRDRPTASPLERARVSVTKLLRKTIARIAESDAELGAHLEAAIRTGTFCTYQPSAPETWAT